MLGLPSLLLAGTIIAVLLILLIFAKTRAMVAIRADIIDTHREIVEQILRDQRTVGHIETQRLRDPYYMGYAQEVERVLHIERLKDKKESLWRAHDRILCLREQLKRLECQNFPAAREIAKLSDELVCLRMGLARG